MDLTDLQAEHQAWLEHNFPDQVAHQPLLGVAEEVGELCHHHLKHEQHIRGGQDDVQTELEIIDAIGDIVIYLASYCNTNGLSLNHAVMYAWDRVKKRDWKADPVSGGEA